MNRDTDIIKPLSETLHIGLEQAEDMLNKLNKLKGLSDMDALMFILEHFGLCINTSIANRELVKNYDRLSGNNLGWALDMLDETGSFPPKVSHLCEKEMNLFIKDFLAPTIWAVYYRSVFNELPNRKEVKP